jgi:hypothetical protein
MNRTVNTTAGAGGQRLWMDAQLLGTGKLSKRTQSSNRFGLDLGCGSCKGVVALNGVGVLSRVAPPL